MCILDLIPTLLSLSSVQVHYSAFTSSLEQISAYLSRYRTRLSPSHVLHLKRLTTFLSAIKEFGAKWQEQRQRSPENQQEVLTIVELIHHLGRHVEGINLLEIGNYLRSSKVSTICFR
jgi:chromosome transmission fidelity protein 1